MNQYRWSGPCSVIGHPTAPLLPQPNTIRSLGGRCKPTFVRPGVVPIHQYYRVFMLGSGHCVLFRCPCLTKWQHLDQQIECVTETASQDLALSVAMPTPPMPSFGDRVSLHIRIIVLPRQTLYMSLLSCDTTL